MKNKIIKISIIIQNILIYFLNIYSKFKYKLRTIYNRFFKVSSELNIRIGIKIKINK